MRSAEDSVSTPPKKVRLACRRCRAKRVKCDGGVPACSHCARAGVSCVDVDGRNNDRSIPRDYAARCHARINWLERAVRRLDPDFDLSQGPQLDSEGPEARALSAVVEDPLQRPSSEQPIEPASSRKRSHATFQAAEAEQIEPPPTVEARSVAMDLGMLSLHSDSRQKHYLGSSSGLFFTNLIGADSEALTPASPAGPIQSHSSHRFSSPSENHRSLYRKLSKELPTTEEACVLLGVYLREIHVDHPCMHLTSLFQAYKALCVCVDRAGSYIDSNGWPEEMTPFSYNGRYDRVDDKDTTPVTIFTATLHVFMVFSLAATVLTRNKNFDFSPARFYKLAASAAPECLSTITVPGLQSIILFTVQGMISPTNLNIWTLAHIAMSHCIDLGLHREPKDLSEFSSEALAMRRFIFYTVYDLDRSISTIQGRPLGIRDETFDLRLPTVAEIPGEPEPLIGRTLRLPEDMMVTIHRFRMDKYISEIKMLFYHLPTQSRVFHWPTDHAAEQTRLKTCLDDWLVEVRETCSSNIYGERGRKPFKLEVLYHGTVTLLYQPSQAFPSPVQSALLQCYHSSSERVRLYNHLNNEESLHFNWRNIHGIFSSGATIVYCFWASPEIQSLVPFSEALRTLRICSNLLSIGGQWWPTVRNGKENFDRIVDLTIKRLSQLHGSGNASADGQPPHHRRRIGNLEPHRSSAEIAPFEGLPPLAEPEQASNYLATPHSFPFDTLDDQNAAIPSVDSVMENFFTEFLHGDWGWDPFSASLDT
ncbi:hypothetical protein BJY04DRAFT_231118 [Aspergillus karnatakaensis]|uniref:Zn(II)2Cys6 transcription factor n=1 Tax=Aspergillus karnatakaensis TaxID=1810916 RepID=UPI003CCD3E65